MVVTGFRASLNKALEDKRRLRSARSTASVAEDIANFPIRTSPNPLQRIPGVSIARDAGEGRNLSVRGLGPQFTRVRINGMEAMSTTGGTDSSGGTNRNRQFDFNVFASELFNSITARKTASAEVDEGSLGATVDLRTARPFDYKDFTMVGALKGAYNDLAEDVDPRATFLVSNTFGDGQFGVLFSAAYAERNAARRRQQHRALGSRQQRRRVQRRFGVRPASRWRRSTQPAFHPRIPRYGRLTHEQERLGLTGSHCSGSRTTPTSSTSTCCIRTSTPKRDENFLEAFSFSRTAAQGGKPATLIRRRRDRRRTARWSTACSMTSTSAPSRVTTSSRRCSTPCTLSATHQLSDSWELERARSGYSRSDFNNPIQTTITLDRSNSDGYSYDFRDSSRLPAFNYNFDVTNPANWIFGTFPGGSSEIRLRPQGVDNTFQVGKIDLKFVASDNRHVQVRPRLQEVQLRVVRTAPRV